MNDGDLILDPCAGSFAVLDVAVKNNRKFIGGDIEKEFCDE